jgi:hypothetical protein
MFARNTYYEAYDDLDLFVLFVIQFHTSKAIDAHKQTIKIRNLGLNQVPFYAKLDVSATVRPSACFAELSSRIHACVNRLVWRHRRDFIARGTKQNSY